MAEAKRTILLVVFVLAAMLIGLALGTVIGGIYLVPAGSGLAGPVIALGYGVVGALVALVVALVGIKTVPRKWQSRVAAPVLVAGLVVAVLIGRGMAASRAASDAFMAEAYENMNRFDVSLRYEPGVADADFNEFHLDWNVRELTVRFNDNRACTAPVPPAQAVTMLSALRAAEGVLYREPFPCAGSLGNPERHLEFTIIEAMPPNNSGDLAITAACTTDYPALSQPFEAAAAILASGQLQLTCSE